MLSSVATVLRRPRNVVILTVVVFVAGGAIALLLSRSALSPGPGGDPHGEVLKALSSVRDAVPSGSTDVTTSKRDALWTTACPGMGLKDGWSPVTDLTTFATSDSVSNIVASVGRRLTRDGWVPSPPHDDAAWQYTPIAEWSKPVAGATSAVVVVFSYSIRSATGSTTWMLGAEAKTVGYALPGC
ncbi:MAG TPA: hypothetical protein VNG12_07010 [Acidimicrobiales bacterium]|nr:hypothetical protein [Acidimicrobiales bacterium]